MPASFLNPGHALPIANGVMVKFSRFLIVKKFAASLVLVSLCACSPSLESEWSVEVGDKVPEFSLVNTDGETVSSATMLGKPYVISVFATWCPPCKTELIALEEKVWQPLKDQGIGVLAINYGQEDAATIGNFFRSNNLTFQALVDESGSFRQATGVAAVPHSMVVDADGDIIELHLGYTDESVAQIAETLKEAKED